MRKMYVAAAVMPSEGLSSLSEASSKARGRGGGPAATGIKLTL